MKDYNVLYVDDEQANLNSLKSLFRKKFNIILANSGHEALSILENQPVHLIIADQRMPEMTGIEFLKKVKLQWPELRSILLTAYEDIEVIKEAVNVVGVYWYLNKPFDHNKLENIIRNAIEAKRTDELLKISEEKFRGVFNSMIDVFIRRGLDGIIQLVSPSLIDVTGYTPEELAGKHVSGYFVDPQMDETIKQKLLEHGGIHNFQMEIFKKDKSIITISSNAKLFADSTGKQIGIESVFRDITLEMSAKRELKESEGKFRGVFESISDVFVRGNMKGDVILVSPSVFDITGYTVEEILNQNISGYLVHPEHQKLLFQKLIEEGGVQYSESEIIHKNGTVRTISINAKLYYDKNANPLGVESIFRDITDKKITERKILESQTKLKELTHDLTVTEERMKKQIAIDLHDDVGQLLTSSRMQLAGINYDSDPKLIKKKINDVSAALLYASKATREVIFNLSPPQLQAIGLYAATHDWMKEEIEQKYGIRTLISGDKVIYELDENTRFLLFRSIRELLINVVKHAQARFIRIRFINRDRSLEIVVKDDGIGFEYDPKNFKFSKKGLGLFSIEERVSNLGGSLTIVSRRNFGTEIRLIIPIG